MAAAKVTKKAATTKATTTKKVAKKPAATVKKAPVKKQAPKQEVVEEEKPKLTWKQKLALGAGAVGAIVGAIALHGRSKYNEGAADQAVADISAYSNTPVDVNVYLTDKQAEEEPVEPEADEEQIEEI